MNIFALNIKNFRSITNLWVFPNSDVNILVGPNNCGKSTVLKAMQLILDPSLNYRQQNVITRFDFHKADTSIPIEIIIWLKASTKTIKNSDGSESKAWKESDEIQLELLPKTSEWIIEWEERTADYKHPVRLKPFLIEPMAINVPEHERLLSIKISSTWDDAQEVADTEINFVDQLELEISRVSNKHKELLGFRFFGTRRDPAYELSLAKRSILSRMVSEDEMALALRELLRMLDESKNQVVDKPSIKNLFDRLGKIVAPELVGGIISDIGTEFSLTFLGGDSWKLRGATSIATSMLGKNQQEKILLPLEYQGDGAQNLILLAHIIDLMRDKNSNNIIALEEPEQNLEPTLAKWIFGQLCNLSNDSSGQLFISTHSPALVNEIRGAQSVLIFSDKSFKPTPLRNSTKSIISGQYLPPDAKKKLDQFREQYIDALFSKMVLIVEGPSEIGFLPVAFHHFAGNSPFENPYHLGLTIVNAGGKKNVEKEAEQLLLYNRKIHLLYDNDPDDEEAEDKQKRIDRFGGKMDFITCWPETNLVSFATGCDLEIILAGKTPIIPLFDALKEVYADAGHHLQKNNWEKAIKKLNPDFQQGLPNVYGDFDLNSFEISTLGDEAHQRAFLFALLHGPHECKATKDMRMLAKYLADKKVLPDLFNTLRIRLLESMRNPEKIDHDHPYLAA